MANITSAWRYYSKLTIDNTGNSSALTNYQVKISLTSTNFDFTKANSDGSDIRFTDGNKSTLLSYWIESWDSSGQTATIWVKVPSISASSTKTIYLFYGNAGAVSASDGNNVFLFFDDFEDGTIDTNKWTYIRGTWEETGGYVHVTTDSSGAPGNILRGSYNAGSYIARSKIKLPDTIQNDGTIIVHEQSDNTGYLSINGAQGTSVLGYNYWDGTAWGSCAGTTYSYSAGDIIIEEVYVNGTDIIIYDRTNSVNYSWSSSYSSGYTGLHQGNGATTTALFYWFFVRQYTSSEPTTSVGAVQSNSSHVIMFSNNF